jgi:hypothetical protein
MDLKWFTEGRTIINGASSARSVPPQLTAAFNFLRNSLVGNVSLLPYRGGFVPTPGAASNAATVAFDGLTDQLKRVFYPVKLDVPTGGGRTGGASRGCAVDRELADLINLNKMPAGGTLHPYTVKTLTQLQREKFKPFACQVAVAYPQLNIATALDIVCVTTEGKLVNIQLKTGFDKNYNTAQGCLFSPFVKCPPLSQMPDSHASRHMIQLMAEHVIVQMAYGEPLLDSYLLIISEDTHTLISTLKNPALAVGIYQNLQKRNETPALALQLDLTAQAIRQRHVQHAMRNSARKRRGNAPPKLPIKKK